MSRVLRFGERPLRALVFLTLLSFCSAAPGGELGAVATAHPLATEAGVQVLKQGGNAFDAAVAISAVLGVVEPWNSGLGGGGYFLLHDARAKRDVVVDARERAPLESAPGMYFDADGHVHREDAVRGGRAVAVPGTPAALAHLAGRYGRLPLSRSLLPAIRLARRGFISSPGLTRATGAHASLLAGAPEAARIFLSGGMNPPAGSAVHIHQPELAVTLEALARHGHEGFYTGPVAEKLIRGVREAGGSWSRDDLLSYGVLERSPLVSEFSGWRVVTVPPSSAGGLVLLQSLRLLDAVGWASLGPEQRARVEIEALRLSWRDRECCVGDPEQRGDSTAQLLGGAHLRELQRALVLRMEAQPLHPPVGAPGGAIASPPQSPSGTDTTAFAVIDRAGNRVAASLSLNRPFGAGVMPAGTGVLLNNHMDDFQLEPARHDGIDLGALNGIAAGARPLSSQTPVFLERGNTTLAFGSPGGRRIPSMALGATLEAVRSGGDPDAMVRRPRVHHEFRSPFVEHEVDALSPNVRANLSVIGFELREVEEAFGNMQVVRGDRGTRRFRAASDPRGEGRAVTVR